MNTRLRTSLYTSVLLCCSAFPALSQVTGLAVDSASSAALDSVSACLVALGECDTTASDGLFSVGSQTGIPAQQVVAKTPMIRLRDGVLTVGLGEGAGPAQVSVYTADGRRVVHHRLGSGETNAVVHVGSGHSTSAQGLMVIVLEGRGVRRVLKNVTFAPFAATLALPSSTGNSLARQMGPAVDTLVVTRSGYVEQRIPVDSYMLSVDSVKMVAETQPVVLNLGAAVQSCRAVALSWQVIGDGVIGFLLERDESQSGTYAVLAQPDTTDAVFSDATALPYSNYGYRLHALDAQGDTLATATASASTKACGSWRDAIAYQIAIDRFVNGDPTNDSAVDGVSLISNFRGGDFAGIHQKLDEGYFDDLGFNTLILSFPGRTHNVSLLRGDGNLYAPIMGEEPSDLSLIEENFGDSTELRNLIDAVHDRGMRIVTHYQAHHVHTGAAIFSDNPGWFHSPCVCGEPGCEWGGAGQYECMLQDYLPAFDHSVPEALAYSQDNAFGWLLRAGFDGLLIDRISSTDPVWVRQFRTRLDSDTHLLSEEPKIFGVYVTVDLVEIRRHAAPDTGLDGLMDDFLRYQIVEHLLSTAGDLQELAMEIAVRDTFLHDSALMLTTLGSHNTVRAIHLAEEPALYPPLGGGYSEAWTYPPGPPSDAAAYERLGLGHVVLYTSPGIPTIFYGDEVGMAGAAYPDNVRPMVFEVGANQIALSALVTRLAQIRSAHTALRYGTRETLQSTVDTWAYRMADESDTVYVAINRSSTSKTFSAIPAGTFVNELTETTVSSVQLDAWKAGIYVRQ